IGPLLRGVQSFRYIRPAPGPGPAGSLCHIMSLSDARIAGGSYCPGKPPAGHWPAGQLAPRPAVTSKHLTRLWPTLSGIGLTSALFKILTREYFDQVSDPGRGRDVADPRNACGQPDPPERAANVLVRNRQRPPIRRDGVCRRATVGSHRRRAQAG